MKRIAPGYYEGKGIRIADNKPVTIQIIKRGQPDKGDGYGQEPLWYFELFELIERETKEKDALFKFCGGEDYYSSKKSAIQAADTFLNNCVRNEKWGWVMKHG